MRISGDGRDDQDRAQPAPAGVLSRCPANSGLGPPAVRQATIAALRSGYRVTQLALGSRHTCALLESGRVACWGNNGMGELGNGSDQPSSSPTLVPHVSDIIEVRASRATTCARSAANTGAPAGSASGSKRRRRDPATTGEQSRLRTPRWRPRRVPGWLTRVRRHGPCVNHGSST